MNESEPYQFERSKGYLIQENQTPTNQERSSNRSIRSQSSGEINITCYEILINFLRKTKNWSSQSKTFP